MKNYLPSKKFITGVLFLAVLVILFFTAKIVISFFKGKKSNTNIPVKIVTIGDITQKDSNNNDIPDWEEYLWGLDPNKNGAKNREFILSKKKSLTENGLITPIDDNRTISDNEALSQEFFAAIISLQQTGTLNDESLKSITDAIGGNIAVEDIKDVYALNMMTIKNDSSGANDEYQAKLASLINKYGDADIGKELTFIIQGLNNNDPQALYAAKTVGMAYQNFGKELIKLPVPRSLADLELSAANNYEKTGQSIIGLTMMLEDPIKGMKSILNYKKYNDSLAGDLEKMSEILQ